MLVFLYGVAMLRPLQPFVEYAVNYDYISKVLCINKELPESSCKGKCQLMKKLESQQKKDFQSLRIHIEEYPIGFVELLEVDNNTHPITSKTNHNFIYDKNYTSRYLDAIFQPPIV